MNKKKQVNKFKGCSRTYASLRIYHASADPEQVTNILQIKPDWIQNKGEKGLHEKATRSEWYLGTRDRRTISRSKDLRTHIEWILNKLSSKQKELQKLSKLGYEMWIFCFWGSRFGNGGPILDHKFLEKLSKFPFDIYIDVWYEPD